MVNFGSRVTDHIYIGLSFHRRTTSYEVTLQSIVTLMGLSPYMNQVAYWTRRGMSPLIGWALPFPTMKLG